LTPDMQLMTAVRETLNTHAMLARGDRVLVGLSGGGDSMALLDILVRLAPELGIGIGAAHLNHGLRAAADAEAATVARWVAKGCFRQAGLPFFSAKRSIPALRRQKRLSIEEAARNVRHGYLREVARRHGYTHIATGHHRDDNAESVLLFLLRGAGPEGLRGIPPIRPAARGGATLIRPLLGVARTEIEAYLCGRGLPFLNDESNCDPGFTRNRIRHQLMPLLKAEYNPRIGAALNRSAAILAEERKWLEPAVARWVDYLARPLAGGGLEFEAGALQRMPAGLQRQIVRQAVCRVKGDLRRIDYDHVVAVAGLCADDPLPCAVDLPGRIRCRRSGPLVAIFPSRGRRLPAAGMRPPGPPAVAAPHHYAYLVPPPRRDGATQVVIPELNSRFQFTRTVPPQVPLYYRPGQSMALFDMDKLRFPLRIRSVQPGDRFRPPGGGAPRKVNQYLYDHNISRAARSAFPLLVCGSEILWVVGLGTGEAGEVAPASRNILKVERQLVS